LEDVGWVGIEMAEVEEVEDMTEVEVMTGKGTRNGVRKDLRRVSLLSRAKIETLGL
jgi:hypothetical protein